MKRPSTRTLAMLAGVALVPAAAAIGSVGVGTYRELDRFMTVFERVKADYVVPVDDKKLIKGAIDGMLSSLDAESGYYAADDGNAAPGQAGAGLTVTIADGALSIVAPTPGGPAARAGIKPGDFISHINGELVFGLPLKEAVARLNGAPGTPLKLTVARRGRTKPFDVELVRALPAAEQVGWRVERGVGILEVKGVGPQTAAGLRTAIDAIRKAAGDHDPLGYVIDLRSNAGGTLDASVQLADAFLDKGEIVSERGRDAADIVRQSAKKGDFAEGVPLIVLIDRGSASAAEIVAGALKDNGRALVMGEQSFGMGTIQTVVPLDAGGKIRITTRRFFTPSGQSINEKGIEPDLVVPQLSDVDRPKADTGRFADLRRQIIREAKVDQAILEDDSMPDPRFKATPDELKKQGISDFQMNYAIATLERLGRSGAAPAATRRR